MYIYKLQFHIYNYSDSYSITIFSEKPNFPPHLLPAQMEQYPQAGGQTA